MYTHSDAPDGRDGSSWPDTGVLTANEEAVAVMLPLSVQMGTGIIEETLII